MSSEHEQEQSTSISVPKVRETEYEEDDNELRYEVDQHEGEGLLNEKGQGRERTSSLSGSLHFDFTRLDLASTSEDSPSRNAGSVPERLSRGSAIALCVGMQIGGGIFSSPGIVARGTGSVLSSLLVWYVVIPSCLRRVVGAPT